MLGYLSDIIVYNSDFNIDSKIDSVLLTRITHFSLKNRTAKQV
jgi:hypothetical protein